MRVRFLLLQLETPAMIFSAILSYFMFIAYSISERLYLLRSSTAPLQSDFFSSSFMQKMHFSPYVWLLDDHIQVKT